MEAIAKAPVTTSGLAAFSALFIATTSHTAVVDNTSKMLFGIVIVQDFNTLSSFKSQLSHQL